MRHHPRSIRAARGHWLPILLLCLVGVSGAATSRSDPLAAGASAFASGDFEGALASWSAALERLEAEGNATGSGQALLRKGEAYVALARYPQAIQSLRRAVDLAASANDRSLLAEATASLGNAYLLAGLIAEAEAALASGRDMASGLGRDGLAAQAGNNLGNLHASQGRFDAGRAAYEPSLAAARAAGDRPLAAKVLINLARLSLASGRPAESLDPLRGASELLQGLEPSHDQAYGLIGAARLYLRLDPAETGAAVERLGRAVRSAEAIGDARALSYANGYLGTIYEQAGRHRDALLLTRRAVFAAQQANAPESLYRWQWQTARLLRAQGETQESIVAYRRAVETLQSIRPDLSTGRMGVRVSFRDLVGPVYLELADLLLRHSGAGGDAQARQASLREARATVELLKGAELADYFEDDCVAELKTRTAGIDQLAPGTAAVYPIILADRLELLLSLPDGIKLVTVPVPADDLTREIRDFRVLLERRITHQYLRPARQLYDWIIRPIEAELERNRIETLVVVPDGPLRTVPIAALHDGKQFLVARYALGTTPGLTLTDPRPIERENVKLFASGITEAVQGFPPLPDVAEELETIHGLYGGTLLENEAFRVPRFESELTTTPYTIVHIASHGQFDRDVSNTFVLAYDSKLSMDELGALLGITKFRKEPVELLTLSACQTAAGDDRAALGLAGVAVKSGARSALATLWSVSDRASAILVADFYRQLLDPSLSKAGALRRAQLALLEDRRYRHPAYWSPFLLIGNWL